MSKWFDGSSKAEAFEHPLDAIVQVVGVVVLKLVLNVLEAVL
jgi:hypothetical protein